MLGYPLMHNKMPRISSSNRTLPKKIDSGGNTNDFEQRSKKARARQCLGMCIGYLISRGNMFNNMLALNNTVTNEEMINLNVFYSRLKNWIICKCLDIYTIC